MRSNSHNTRKRVVPPKIVTVEMIESEEPELIRPEKLEKCKLVVQQIEPENKKILHEAFQDAEFWFGKGYSMQKEDGVEVALDYYLQGIRCNPNHYPCVFNLACVYSQLDKHANARKWFNLAIKIAPTSLDAYYGSALSSFKMRCFMEAFTTLKNMPSTA